MTPHMGKLKQSWQFYEDLQDILQLTSKKDVLFIGGDWNAKVGSQETPGVTQIWPWSTECSRTKANRFCQENTLVIANTLFQQQKRRLYTWTSPESILKSDWLYSLQPEMEKLSAVSKNKTRSWLRSWTPYCQIQTETEESRKNH